MATVDISVDVSVFKCPASWTVKTAKRNIRDEFRLTGGGVKCDGVAMDEEETLERSGSFAFVGGVSSTAASAGVSPITTDIEVREYHMKRFIDLLEACGIDNSLNPVKFDKVIEKIQMFKFEQVKGCTRQETAKELYAQFSQITTNTKAQYTARNITIDGELPGAVSNDCAFVRVFVDGRLQVFKHPKNAQDNNVVRKVLADAGACDIIRAANNGVLPDGLVKYTQFSLETSDGVVIQGTLSEIYPLTLDAFHRPLATATLLDILTRVKSVVEAVHKLGCVFCDLKPDNLFLNSQGQVFIGDLEGLTLQNDNIKRITLEYLPDELRLQGIASFSCDWYCLISTALEMMNKRPQSTNVANLRDAVSNLDEGNMKSFLEVIIRDKC